MDALLNLKNSGEACDIIDFWPWEKLEDHELWLQSFFDEVRRQGRMVRIKISLHPIPEHEIED